MFVFLARHALSICVGISAVAIFFMLYQMVTWEPTLRVPLTPQELRSGIDECHALQLTAHTNGYRSRAASKIWCGV